MNTLSSRLSKRSSITNESAIHDLISISKQKDCSSKKVLPILRQVVHVFPFCSAHVTNPLFLNALLVILSGTQDGKVARLVFLFLGYMLHYSAFIHDAPDNVLQSDDDENESFRNDNQIAKTILAHFEKYENVNNAENTLKGGFYARMYSQSAKVVGLKSSSEFSTLVISVLQDKTILLDPSTIKKKQLKKKQVEITAFASDVLHCLRYNPEEVVVEQYTAVLVSCLFSTTNVLSRHASAILLNHFETDSSSISFHITKQLTGINGKSIILKDKLASIYLARLVGKVTQSGRYDKPRKGHETHTVDLLNFDELPTIEAPNSLPPQSNVLLDNDVRTSCLDSLVLALKSVSSDLHPSIFLALATSTLHSSTDLMQEFEKDREISLLSLVVRTGIKVLQLDPQAEQVDQPLAAVGCRFSVEVGQFKCRNHSVAATDNDSNSANPMTFLMESIKAFIEKSENVYVKQLAGTALIWLAPCSDSTGMWQWLISFIKGLKCETSLKCNLVACIISRATIHENPETLLICYAMEILHGWFRVQPEIQYVDLFVEIWGLAYKEDTLKDVVCSSVLYVLESKGKIATDAYLYMQHAGFKFCGRMLLYKFKSMSLDVMRSVSMDPDISKLASKLTQGALFERWTTRRVCTRILVTIFNNIHRKTNAEAWNYMHELLVCMFGKGKGVPVEVSDIVSPIMAELVCGGE